MMDFNFTNKTEATVDKADLEKVAEETISSLKIEGNILLEVIITDEKEIQSLNKKYRNIDRPTDVLSFPQTKILASELNIFGSIVICPKVAEEKNEEISELVKHGILHLAGYDHETDEENWDKAAKLVNHNL